MANDRNTNWLQGDILLREDIQTFFPDTTFQYGVVISHDCDLAAEPTKEGFVEIILAERVDSLLGYAYGKDARTLRISIITSSGETILELKATNKKPIEKQIFNKELNKQSHIVMDASNRHILQKWLAARYKRSAFPEEFENRLRNPPNAKYSKSKPLIKEIEKILDKANDGVVSVFFDLDDGENKERPNNELYELKIKLLYTSEKLDALETAKSASNELTQLIEDAFCIDHEFQLIELMSCEYISDAAMSYLEASNLKQWRIEYLSSKDADLPSFSI